MKFLNEFLGTFCYRNPGKISGGTGRNTWRNPMEIPGKFFEEFLKKFLTELLRTFSIGNAEEIAGGISVGIHGEISWNYSGHF